MRALSILLSLVIAVSAISDYKQWISFKNNHGKIYKTLQEESVRFDIFRKNLKKIEAHNAKYGQGEETYMMGVNQFTDLTQEEFEKKWSVKDSQPYQIDAVFSFKSHVYDAGSVDWREKGAVLDVENQGIIGNSGVFSAIAAMEGQNAIKNNEKILLSPQELVDCIHISKNIGYGEILHQSFQYVRDHGISALEDYKYNGTCKNMVTPRVELNVTGYTMVDKNEEALRQAVEKVGPISITMNASALIFYQNGILNPVNCGKTINHAVLVVGYGTENGTDYWIMKNSWGKNWGEDGFFRIIRNQDSACGLATQAIYPNVVKNNHGIF